MLEKLLKLTMELSKQNGVVAYVCYQGTTDCVSVTIYDRNILVYSRNEFAENLEALCGMLEDVRNMLAVAKGRAE